MTVNSSIWDSGLGYTQNPSHSSLPLNTSLSKEFMTINRIVNISSIDVHGRPTSIMARYDRVRSILYRVSTVGA